MRSLDPLECVMGSKLLCIYSVSRTHEVHIIFHLFPLPSSIFPLTSYLFPAPCSLLPAPCSLKTRNLYLTSRRIAI
ncbi:hypothetical protein, partial [Moorena sp. SIO4G3]|uniref:hypothetical protein n=1 Tax=Moorena sp. SIO4G3 TaxID=2607821 RepID=UPI0025FCAF42